MFTVKDLLQDYNDKANSNPFRGLGTLNNGLKDLSNGRENDLNNSSYGRLPSSQ